MKLFDNCLINGVGSKDLNISQLEFSAEEKGFKEPVFKKKIIIQNAPQILLETIFPKYICFNA